MRRARRVDANQAEIVDGLRERFCSVEPLSDVGRGVCDLLVGREGINYLLEVKKGTEPLNAEQSEWHRRWRGQKAVVRTLDEALRAVGLESREGA